MTTQCGNCYYERNSNHVHLDPRICPLCGADYDSAKARLVKKVLPEKVTESRSVKKSARDWRLALELVLAALAFIGFWMLQQDFEIYGDLKHFCLVGAGILAALCALFFLDLDQDGLGKLIVNIVLSVPLTWLFAWFALYMSLFYAPLYAYTALKGEHFSADVAVLEKKDNRGRDYRCQSEVIYPSPLGSTKRSMCLSMADWRALREGDKFTVYGWKSAVGDTMYDYSLLGKP